MSCAGWSWMREEGVCFVTGVDVGRDKSAQELLDEFDAVILCTGAKEPRDLAVPAGRPAGSISRWTIWPPPPAACSTPS